MTEICVFASCGVCTLVLRDPLAVAEFCVLEEDNCFEVSPTFLRSESTIRCRNKRSSDSS